MTNLEIAQTTEDQDRLWEMRKSEVKPETVDVIDARIGELECTIKEDTV